MTFPEDNGVSVAHRGVGRASVVHLRLSVIGSFTHQHGSGWHGRGEVDDDICLESGQVMTTMLVAVGVIWAVVGVVYGAELAPSEVVNSPQRTVPPAEVLRPQYAQTLYKATDYSTAMNTLQPLWPSYVVEYQQNPITTANNQTISTSSTEFATVLNTTVEYYTGLLATSTVDVAATSYQTMDFQHQNVLYTDNKNITHSSYESNDLPFV
ncbi:uncharacterized protein [Procambarus clarkii]|uniref:uncharacterized protein n=1 Tax=Procambarus clarkii TaxID=6728 RepID=UPI001E67688F|nr:uncharacterized protein LOC123758409 [Procambarus clarkii]